MSRKTEKSKAKTTKKKKKTRRVTKVEKLYNCHNCLTPLYPDQPHDCVPVTEKQLLATLSEDFRDAIEKIRKIVENFGEQRIYNNARAIMFSRRVCYMFVRPKKSFIELVFFLSREEDSPNIHRVDDVSKSKYSHTVRIIHSDQIEGEIIDWLKEAYEYSK